MALFTSISTPQLSVSVSIHRGGRPLQNRGRLLYPLASLSSSPSPSSESKASSPTKESTILSSTTTSSSKPFVVETSRPPDSNLNYAIANPIGSPIFRFVKGAESNIERTIFDFRFLALLAVGGSLAGSLLCFLNVLSLTLLF
ncbi:hypothetical protein CFP56_023422 [Quercus suber]|uniref:Uncharacterized protein n=1 Tax=Quercus suber TaxID=58331 RepID=A0AAW0KAJ8_QUESU